MYMYSVETMYVRVQRGLMKYKLHNNNVHMKVHMEHIYGITINKELKITQHNKKRDGNI